MYWHELNDAGTECAASCVQCLMLQREKYHREAGLPNASRCKDGDNCPACRRYYDWLHERQAREAAEQAQRLAQSED